MSTDSESENGLDEKLASREIQEAIKRCFRLGTKLEKVKCDAKYLCGDLEVNIGDCIIRGRDFEGCWAHQEMNVLRVHPLSIKCSRALIDSYEKCRKYWGRRDSCTETNGYCHCGVKINGSLQGSLSEEEFTPAMPH